MPMAKVTQKKTVGKNVKKMKSEGYGQKQTSALSDAGKSKPKKKGKK